MPTFTELLPSTKSAPRSGFRWTPSTDTVGSGLLIIEAPRVSVTYLVAEFATAWDGRAFHFAKVTEGTDKTSDAEDVFVGRDSHDRQCSCKGFAYGRGKDRAGRVTCKHVGAVLGLIENNWL